MKMMSAKNICSLCIRTDVKFYHLEESIRAPNDLRFEGHKNLQAVLENILNKKGKDRNATTEICQKCRDKLHAIYSLTHQYSESEKILHQITDVSDPSQKLATFPILSNFKAEFEAFETDKVMDPLECNSTVDENSAVSDVVVKMEFDKKSEGTDFNIITKDFNIVFLERKYSNTADNRSFDEIAIDSMHSEEAKQTTIEDEIIKEEWTIQEGGICEAKPRYDGLDRDQTKFSCDRCNEKFSTVSCFKKHSQNVHGFNQTNAEQKTEKELESKTIQSIDLEGQNPKFTTTASLRRHKLSNIWESDKSSFNCDQCEAKYKTSRSLKEHKMSHTDVTITCDQCDASFSNRRSLGYHLRGVHTDAVYSCDRCDATYKHKKNLNAHKHIHNGILFNCDQCDAKYKTKYSLSRHKKSHAGVNLTCNKCDVSYSDKKSLTRHLRKVHTDTLFHCNDSDAIYKSKRTLNEHKLIEDSSIVISGAKNFNPSAEINLRDTNISNHDD